MTGDIGRGVRHVVWTLVQCLLALLAGLVLGYLAAGPTGSVTTLAVVATFVALLGAVVVARGRTVAARRLGLGGWAWSGVPAIAALLIWPLMWGGVALLGWQLVQRGPLSAAVDLVLWSGAVGLGVLWGSARQELQARPATPYS